MRDQVDRLPSVRIVMRVFELRERLEELLGAKADLVTMGGLRRELREDVLAEAIRAAWAMAPERSGPRPFSLGKDDQSGTFPALALVVDAALLVDVGDLEVEAALAGADLADALEQFVEVVVAQMRKCVACRLLTR
jgi:hypothetical protein